MELVGVIVRVGVGVGEGGMVNATLQFVWEQPTPPHCSTPTNPVTAATNDLLPTAGFKP
jgi:hypothetical protein